MKGNNQITCDLCGKKTDHEISHKLRRVPRILHITVGRFIYDAKKKERVKVNKMQAFPLELNVCDLREFP